MINWSITNNMDQVSSPLTAKVETGLNVATQIWSRYLPDDAITIQLELADQEFGGNTLAVGSTTYFYDRDEGPAGSQYAVYQPEILREFAAGVDLDGSDGQTAEFDGDITVDVSSLTTDDAFYINTDISDPSPGVPSNQVSLLSTLVHELGHVLGFGGFADFEDPQDPPGGVISEFESDMFLAGGEVFHGGTNAILANNGASVPITDSHGHIDAIRLGRDDLMDPIAENGTRTPVSELDVALLKDMGYAMREATSGADVLYGFNQVGDVLSLGGGNDRGFGLTGDDTLYGEFGHDRLDGGFGSDVLYGGQGNDRLQGGAGNDTASYAGSNAGVIVKLWNGDAKLGHASGDTLSGIENLTGSQFDDFLVGDGNANVLQGGAGADTLKGSFGVDTASYARSDASVTIQLWANTAKGGHAAGDSLSGIENLNGSAFADNLVGDAGANTLAGGDGDDRLKGGQAGDTFVFAPGTGADTVADFQNDSDQLDLTAFGFADFASVDSLASDTGSGDMLIDFGGGDSVTLVGFAKNDFYGGDVVI